MLQLQADRTPTAAAVDTSSPQAASAGIAWASEVQSAADCPPAPRRAPPAVVLVPTHELLPCCEAKVVAYL